MMTLRRFDAYKLRLLFAVVLTLSFFSSSRAEAAATPIPPACSQMLKLLKGGLIDISEVQKLSKQITCFYELALQEQTIRDALAAVQKSASTIQTGAPASSNGTTSAVSKPFAPLSLATEYGGITTSTSNQTMTLQTTLDGIPSALATHGKRPYCISPIVTIPGCLYWKNQRWLNSIGVGVTANTTSSSQNVKGTAAPPQGTAQQASLTSAGAKSPSLSSVFANVTFPTGKYTLPTQGPPGKAVADAQRNLAVELGDLGNYPSTVMSSEVWKNYQDWQDCVKKVFTTVRLSGEDDSQIDDEFFRYYAKIAGILFRNKRVECSLTPPEPAPATAEEVLAPSPPGAEQKRLIDAFDAYVAAASLFEASLAQMVLAAAKPVFSFEYDFNTSVNQPTTSTVKVVGSLAFGPTICAGDKSKANTKRFTDTLNVGENFYNSTPSGVPGAGAFRDVQAGDELDIALCSSSKSALWSFITNSTLGLTYYYQDQVSPSILKVTPGMPVSGISIVGLDSSTSSIFAKKGPISFIQLKYGFGTGKNVKFPVAVSWSNRTDLITHALWSAQFGVSYDFSSLLNSSSSTSTSGNANAAGGGQ